MKQQLIERIFFEKAERVQKEGNSLLTIAHDLRARCVVPLLQFIAL